MTASRTSVIINYISLSIDAFPCSQEEAVERNGETPELAQACSRHLKKVQRHQPNVGIGTKQEAPEQQNR